MKKIDKQRKQEINLMETIKEVKRHTENKT